MISRSRTLATVLVLLVVGVTAALAQVYSQAAPTLAGSTGELSIDCNAQPPSIIDAGGVFSRPADPAPGVQSDCSHAPGSTFWVGINATAVPAGGHFGFQTKLRWTEGVVNYNPVPEADPARDSGAGPGEAIWSDCTIRARAINVPTDPSVLFACIPFPSLTSGDTGLEQLLVFQLQCKTDFGASAPAGLDPNQAALTLVPLAGDAQGGTNFLDAAINEIEPALVGATVSCEGEPPPPPPPPLPRWDVNEDGAVSAADIFLVVVHFGETFETGISLGGVWNVNFTGDSSFSCTIEFTQAGSSFTSFADCLFSSGSGAGTIDRETGAFTSTSTIGTSSLDTAGTVSGNSMSGTWEVASLGVGGVFQGTRK